MQEKVTGRIQLWYSTKIIRTKRYQFHFTRDEDGDVFVDVYALTEVQPNVTIWTRIDLCAELGITAQEDKSDIFHSAWDVLARYMALLRESVGKVYGGAILEDCRFIDDRDTE